MKNYAVILAGGVGKRMGGDTPKQFIKIHGIPIIILTIKNIFCVGKFDDIYIAIGSDWQEKLQELLAEYRVNQSNIHLVSGGKERLDSINNAIGCIQRDNVIDSEDVVVVHDAVRPFTSQRIFNESINKARQLGACVATVSAKDTMMIAENGIVKSIPDRSSLFHGQAPDSFKLEILSNALHQLTDDERKKITGTAQICHLKGITVYTIEGDYNNIKITTPEDINIAEEIIQLQSYKFLTDTMESREVV